MPSVTVKKDKGLQVKPGVTPTKVNLTAPQEEEPLEIIFNRLGDDPFGLILREIYQESGKQITQTRKEIGELDCAYGDRLDQITNHELVANLSYKLKELLGIHLDIKLQIRRYAKNKKFLCLDCPGEIERDWLETTKYKTTRCRKCSAVDEERKRRTTLICSRRI